MNIKQKHGLSTLCVHAGAETDPAYDSVVTPIYQTTTYKVPDIPSLIPRHIEKKGYTYSSSGNPTQRAAEQKIAALENSEDAAVFSAGMGAITASINSLVNAGDEIIAQLDLYGDTYRFLKDLENTRHIKTRFFSTEKAETIEELINEKTKILYLESPTNPLLKLVDIEKATNIAKKHGITTILDNTFASPMNQRGLEQGVDIVVQSATKSLSGHHHVICGAAAGASEHIKLMKRSRIVYGQVLDPFGAFLLITGMQTYSLRMQTMNKNTKALAKLLEDSPKIKKVYYPGLVTHPQYNLASNQMKDYGSILSFETEGGMETLEEMFKGFEIVKLATSLGGVDTIATVPSITIFGNMPKEEQKKIGIDPGLVRISVGIEDYSDLEEDFKEALSCIP